MRTAPRLRIPRKGWLGRVGLLLVGCAVLVGCQRPVAQPGSEAPVAADQMKAGRPVSIAIPAATSPGLGQGSLARR